MAEEFDLFADPFFSDPEKPVERHEDYCKQCYEVAPGIFWHSPKTGEAYAKWTEDWRQRSIAMAKQMKKEARNAGGNRGSSSNYSGAGDAGAADDAESSFFE